MKGYLFLFTKPRQSEGIITLGKNIYDECPQAEDLQKSEVWKSEAIEKAKPKTKSKMKKGSKRKKENGWIALRKCKQKVRGKEKKKK